MPRKREGDSSTLERKNIDDSIKKREAEIIERKKQLQMEYQKQVNL